MRRSIVFFDLDGTLCDSMPHLIALLVRLLAEHFDVPEELSRKRVPEILKLSRPEQTAGLADLAGVEFSPDNERVTRYRAQVNAGMGNLTVVLFPEVSGVLRRLWERDYVLVLTTNGAMDSLDARLTDANVRNYFSLLLGTDLPSGMIKGPDHIKRAGQEFGLSAEELAGRAVLVGDAESDMSMAKAAGMLAIGRLTNDNGPSLTAAGADYLIDDLLGLEPVLVQLDLAD